MTVEDFLDHRGDEARSVRRVKFKLHDKQAALGSLGRHLGIFDQKARKPAKVKVEIAQIRETVLRALDRLANARAEAGGDRIDESGAAGEVST